MVGKLEVYVGGMFAEKSTNLIRQGKRHLIAGRKVVFLKPEIDGRYADDAVVTHDGEEYTAINLYIDEYMDYVDDFGESTSHPMIRDADVICIDEVQFFPPLAIKYIDELLYSGKQVYVAGLDMDRFGNPFGIIPELMARAEEVKKFHAVCQFCGDDAWITLGTDKVGTDNQVVVGNDFTPACRQCAYDKGLKL